MNPNHAPGIPVFAGSQLSPQPLGGPAGKYGRGIDIQGAENPFIHVDDPHHSVAQPVFRFDAEIFFDFVIGFDHQA